MKISNYISKQLVSNLTALNIIENENSENYEYCFDFLFDILFFTLSIFVIGCVLKKPFQGLLLIVALFPTKMLAGGAHANSVGMCSFISYIVILFIFYLSNHSICIANEHILIINVFASIAIIIMAPVEHVNKRFSSNQRKKLKRLCAIYLLCTNILFLIFYRYGYTPYFTLIAICDMIIALNQIIGILLNHKRRTR